ncbi:MAG: helix-turn-helix transcriptional regulator [Colwellia sp.]|nr:helix-turn-helix transcriptional regulator [Colwellia sp.]
MAYSDETLKTLQQAWQTFKTSTSMSQAKAAKAIGMNQSAFSQYLRGEIPLNTDFIAKFSVLTKAEIVDASPGSQNEELTAYPIRVSSTLSGRTLEDTITLVPLVLRSPDTYAILVDYSDASEPEGTLIIANKNNAVRDKDTVLFWQNGTKPIYGSIRYLQSDVWEVLEPYLQGGHRHSIDDDSVIHRVSGILLPEKKGKVFRE